MLKGYCSSGQYPFFYGNQLQIHIGIQRCVLLKSCLVPSLFQNFCNRAGHPVKSQVIWVDSIRNTVFHSVRPKQRVSVNKVDAIVPIFPRVMAGMLNDIPASSVFGIVISGHRAAEDKDGNLL